MQHSTNNLPPRTEPVSKATIYIIYVYEDYFIIFSLLDSETVCVCVAFFLDPMEQIEYLILDAHLDVFFFCLVLCANVSLFLCYETLMS